MIPKPRSLRVLRNPIGLLILLAAAAAAAGCTNSNTSGDVGGVIVNHVDASGNSIPGWLTPTGGTHANSATMNYIATGGSSSCTECHGSDLAGGISRVSCFANTAGCHHGPIPNWNTAAVHGATAKLAPGSSGFASCQICHGNNFSGGGTGIACSDCHGPAHPLPWRVVNGSAFDHNSTNTANAPVCYGCHADSPAGNLNNPHRPPTPAAAGTPPGCFNGTMCHNQPGAPHPVGIPAWRTTPPAAQPHGDAAKATSGSTTGFAYCQDCHGTGTTSPANFGGGLSGVSCYTCHGPNAPHAPAPWRASAGSAYSHTSTDAANAPVCQQCHFFGSPNNPAGHPPTPAPAGTAPGCFNSTLCHGSVASHPVPFNDNTHYDVVTATFEAACSACHDVSAPSTKSGPVCRSCHVAASPLTSLNCTSCHANPPDGGTGAVYANIAGAHGAHLALDNTGSPISCETCHNGLGPSLLNLSHYDRAKSRVPPGDLAFLATYNAKSGASSFSSAGLSCSNVSCHGGQATPNWQTGTVDVNTQCTNCHAQGTAQYNSYNSGEHQLHVGGQGILCGFCHNTTALAVDHFTTLADNSISPAVASATIGGAGTLITTWTAGAGTSGTCNAACHPGDRTW